MINPSIYVKNEIEKILPKSNFWKLSVKFHKINGTITIYILEGPYKLTEHDGFIIFYSAESDIVRCELAEEKFTKLLACSKQLKLDTGFNVNIKQGRKQEFVIINTLKAKMSLI